MALAAFKSIPLPISQLSLAAVLKCGQSFRWSILTPFNESEAGANPNTVEYRLCLKDRVVCLRQSPDTLYYRSVFPDPQPAPNVLPEREAETLLWLKDYFQLKVDLAAFYRQWAERDKVFARFQERFEGIRILRQEPWENLVSFICSSNNNISRITKMVQNLCLHYSTPLLSMPHPFEPNRTMTYHPFPPPSALAKSGVGLHLRTLGFGYRADYIQKTAKMLVDTHGAGTPKGACDGEPSEIWLRQLRDSTTKEAREQLLKFVGVGRKVADCILLMSLDKKEVVPVDTHVYQIAVKYYGIKASSSGKATMSPKLYEELNSKFVSIWGDYAGWAHTVLFTADLKSFATYGLTPTSSPNMTPKAKKAKKAPSVPPTPPLTPALSPLKRKLEFDLEDGEELLPATISELCEEAENQLSLADRVKKRRRKA